MTIREPSCRLRRNRRGSETMDSIQRPITMSMSTRSAYDLDLRDVRGQSGARRALEIAAAGRHNLLMIGPPGCGKTMLAVRLPGLFPVADGDTECPFRAPHHTATAMAMLGSAGEVPQPGEVSRADGGVLFLDELPEFSRAVLVGLREPLKHGAVTLSCAADSTTLPARFQLVAAMEPCPCGECDETQGIRRCTAEQMARYHARVAGTVGEHLHVVVEMRRRPAEGDALEGEASAPVRARIAQAQRTQRQRWETLNQRRRGRYVARRRIAFARRRTAAWHGAEETPSLAAQDRDRAAGGADHRRLGTVGAHRSGARRRSGGVSARRPRCVVRRARMMLDVIDTATEGCEDAQ